MAAFTLDAIRAAAEQKYGSTDVTLSDGTNVRLVNALRLPKEKRDVLTSIQTELDADAEHAADVDQAEVFSRALLVVSEDEALGKRLLAEIGDDLALLAELFETYGKATQVGEASASAS